MFPLVPLTMEVQEVCQDKVQTAGLSVVRAAKLQGQSLVNPREALSVVEESRGSVDGSYNPRCLQRETPPRCPSGW